MSYESWRISFQSGEQAAQAAYKTIEQLLAVIAVKDGALKYYADGEHIRHLSNGECVFEYGDTAQESLAIKPEDVSLVEVGEVEHELDHDGMSRGQFGSLAQSWIIPMYTKLYTIKHK